jgi:hypothetical protein
MVKSLGVGKVVIPYTPVLRLHHRILENVQRISQVLVGHPGVSETLRRVVFVELFVHDGALRSKLHWVAARPLAT